MECCSKCGMPFEDHGTACRAIKTVELKPYKCPCCDGSGIVSRLPDVPGDMNSWPSTKIQTYSCNACKGSGIVWGPN